MNAINLYILTRSVSSDVLPLYEKSISLRESTLRIRSGELDMISDMIEKLLSLKMDSLLLNNWFYSFSIPQISKEFDLLKIGHNAVVNIEIKQQAVDISKIKKQLKQNKYYLSNISATIFNFTCMRNASGNLDVYRLRDDNVEISTFAELKSAIELITDAVDSKIESLFRPRDYLISPINTPERFLAGEYFLNNQQENIKNRIVSGIHDNNNRLWGINGSAGTGKTLLLYDIAKELSSYYRVCIIHAGMLANGHKLLSNQMERVAIIDAKHASKEKMEKFDIICVDESQRLYKTTIDDILELLDLNSIRGCIFSYDYAQCLSKTERKWNNPEKLRQVAGFKEEKLSEKIRTNKSISSFIRSMLRLTDRPQKTMNYDCIDILYANTVNEADQILAIYGSKDYKFITLTPSQYYANEIDHYARNDNSHQVIGQEFDNVIIIMDNNFRYGEEGALEGRVHPNPDYLFSRLFYQNITRAREKLCVVVLNNPSVFEILLRLKNNEEPR